MLINGSTAVCDSCFASLCQGENNNESIGAICQSCVELAEIMPRELSDHLRIEFDRYLRDHSRVVFAYSGGLDSTVVLLMLAEECSDRNIHLDTFTIDTGVKGSVAITNVNSVIKWLGIGANHRMIESGNDIQDQLVVQECVGEPMSMVQVYLQCFQLGIIPCGKVCNTMVDDVYKRVLVEMEYKELITGGDTPKKDIDGEYSIFWQKQSGITVIRGGAAYGISKRAVSRIVEEKQIPWVHPCCGGYDTDCLVPGAILSDMFRESPQTNYTEIATCVPLIIDYISERLRFGVFSREEARCLFNAIDIASSSSYNELVGISKALSRPERSGVVER